MNIREAKEQIKQSIKAYFSKDEFGKFIIPAEKQRPIFLLGPPGIGKTAIMEQIASEMEIGLLSYSMTHHTRQSALGLPFIERKNFNGKEYSVSEYTMSEIIASIYDMMEDTGIKEGMLFLDEINCVSETLSPVMLQFLQYKVFGKHRVPEGWIVLTAGNPPEYNDSVREFDMVTWDRLKRIDIDADFDVWKEYAYKVSIHPAIMTYLEIKKENFYKVESTVDGKNFVTARAWDDLSQMIYLYEKHEFTVDNKLISQYLQNKIISDDFSHYYDLFNKYSSDYGIEKIINGDYTDELVERAKRAEFDERLSLIGLLLDGISSIIKENIEKEELISEYKNILLALKSKISSKNDDINKIWNTIMEEKYIEREKKLNSNSLDKSKDRILNKLLALMNELSLELKDFRELEKGFDFLKSTYHEMQKDYQKDGTKTREKLSNIFKFLDRSFDGGSEVLIFVSEISLNHHTARFINKFGCKEFFENSKELLIFERKKEILSEIDTLDI